MAVALSFLFLLLITLYSSTQQQVSAQLILEQGYTVSTVLNANKLPHPINPSSLLPTLNNAGGTHSVFVLDSPSSVFYTVPFPISQDGDVRRYAGNGSAGFVDGELSFAKFDRPRSFAVDFKGNVYVADKSNHAIRKISKSGVTTIAGGHSRKPGNVDGPAQNASFSEDFELVFVPGVCALLITDRGNRLVRQMNLKPNDCKVVLIGNLDQLDLFGWGLYASSSAPSLPWLSPLLLIHSSSLVQEIIGYHWFSETWKHCQINLERQVVIVCSDIKSVVVSFYFLVGRLVRMSLSQLSLMFRIPRVEKQFLCREPSSLFSMDGAVNHEITKPQIYADQLKDMMSFDEDLDVSEETDKTFKQGDEDHDKSDVSTSSNGAIDAAIHANFVEFANQARQKHPMDGPFVGNSGLVKRK
ncbi:hypothetical protein IFM89_032145 [Coptis chinensis]|uniref:NHL repeat-containing protein n=1 Tax=Coptis chinensis TaxID=261450 RepID=A0A835IY86_9MAGN|nr:hypothetical protein IFM89_032145 [Coptis chinensis]